MTDKYELTDKTKELWGHTLYQIKALKDFGRVKKGDLGGWIEKCNNLSQVGTSWVYNHANVFDNAKVIDNAMVGENARVYGHAQVSDYASVYGNADVSDYASVYGNARIYNYALIYGNAHVYDHAKIYGHASVYGDARIYDDVVVRDSSDVFGNAKVFDHAWVGGNTTVSGNAEVYGDSKVQGEIDIRENDEIKDNNSYLIFNNAWSSGQKTVYVLSNHRWHIGGFDGTGEELIRKAYKDSELSGKMYELYVNFAEQVVDMQQQLS